MLTLILVFIGGCIVGGSIGYLLGLPHDEPGPEPNRRWTQRD